MNVGIVGAERDDGGVGALKASSKTALLGGSCWGGGAVVSSRVGGGEGAGGAGWLLEGVSWNLNPFSPRQAAILQYGHQNEAREGGQEEVQLLRTREEPREWDRNSLSAEQRARPWWKPELGRSLQTVQGAALASLSSSQRGDPPWKPELGRSLQEEHSSSTPP